MPRHIGQVDMPRHIGAPALFSYTSFWYAEGGMTSLPRQQTVVNLKTDVEVDISEGKSEAAPSRFRILNIHFTSHYGYS